MDNPEKLTTQDTERRQTKQKTKTQHINLKKMSNTDPAKNRVQMHAGARER